MKTIKFEKRQEQWCDQCNPAMINGVFCHETGCPNQHKVWDKDNQCYYSQVTCRYCGYEVREGDECGCFDKEL